MEVSCSVVCLGLGLEDCYRLSDYSSLSLYLGVQVDPTYTRCGLIREFLKHLILFCQKSIDIWEKVDSILQP